MNTPPVPYKRLPLPANWRDMTARELFGPSLRLPGDYNLDEVPGWLERVEQAEAYKKTLPEFRFPELLKFDKAAHYSFYWNGVRAPLPPCWQATAGRSPNGRRAATAPNRPRRNNKRPPAARPRMWPRLKSSR